MVKWWPSAAGVSLEVEVNGRWPGRSRVADGRIASVLHHKQNPDSDHEPRPDGEVCAWDITTIGIDAGWLAEHLKARSLAGDRRIKYLIYNRWIFNPAISRDWRPYKGADPHTGHIHVSFTPHAAAGPAWGVLATAPPAPPQEDDDMPTAKEIADEVVRHPLAGEGTLELYLKNAATASGVTLDLVKQLGAQVAALTAAVSALAEAKDGITPAEVEAAIKAGLADYTLQLVKA